jgi:hypothetical protein
VPKDLEVDLGVIEDEFFFNLAKIPRLIDSLGTVGDALS